MLTDRELEVMQMLARRGGSTKEAARELGLSRATVRNYRTKIFAKLGASSLIEALTIIGYVRIPPQR